MQVLIQGGVAFGRQTELNFSRSGRQPNYQVEFNQVIDHIVVNVPGKSGKRLLEVSEGVEVFHPFWRCF